MLVPKQASPEARTNNAWDAEGRDGWDAEAAYLNHLLPRASGPSRSLDYLPFLREEGPYALYHRTERPRRTLETHPLFFWPPPTRERCRPLQSRPNVTTGEAASGCGCTCPAWRRAVVVVLGLELYVSRVGGNGSTGFQAFDTSHEDHEAFARTKVKAPFTYG